MKQAYLAGKYSGSLSETHTHVLLAVEAAPQVLAAGFLPIIPHSMFDHRNTTWEDAMARCRALLCQLDPAMDILVALPNWAESRGAREEVALAVSQGIRVVLLAEL